MSIKSRMDKIRESAEQTQLCLNAKTRAVYSVRSSTDENYNYKMHLVGRKESRFEDVSFNRVQVACTRNDGERCPGEKWLCKHVLGAILKKAQDNNKTLTFFDYFSDALKYQNFGGQLIKIYTHSSKKVGWAVVKERKNGKR